MLKFRKLTLVLGDKMFKYDLHVHSIGASACGHDTVCEMMKRYKEIGFTGFALTNHFLHGYTGVDRSLSWQDYVKEYSKYYYDALETAEKLDFDLIFGLEEKYDAGKEILVYGITPETLLANPQLEAMDINIWSNTVRQNGGFIAYAHPFRNRNYIPDPYAMPDISLVDGLEAYNYCNDPCDNELAVKTFKNSGKIIIAGGDLHSVNFNDTFGIITQNRIKNTTDLAQTLKNNQFEIYLGK
ncbi:MAG: PHP domain-containing protein [Clostridia bacterium]|nr:PHP domain-containing protein [Clostridia bacterium]